MDETEIKLLVLDAYSPAGRANIGVAGGTLAGTLYARTLAWLDPDCVTDVIFVGEEDAAAPDQDKLSTYDGVVWTGSDMNVYAGTALVLAQIDLCRDVFMSETPAFGSCWGLQLAVTAAGGRCAPNPRGREFGIGRKIYPTRVGLSHPLFAGRAPAFDALTSHEDEVVELPQNASLLASSAFSRVQAAEFSFEGGLFWGVQYHPEFDMHEVASLCEVRKAQLISQGFFATDDGAQLYIEHLEALHRDPSREDLRYLLGIDDDVLDPKTRLGEVANWLRYVRSR